MSKWIVLGVFFAGIVLTWQYRHVQKQTSKALWWYLCRLGILMCFLGMVLFPVINLQTEESHFVLLVDTSASMAPYEKEIRERIEDFIKEYPSPKGKIIGFDEVSRPLKIESFHEHFGRGKFTDLKKGFDAISNENWKGQVHITLLTDGYVTESFPDIKSIPPTWHIKTLPFSGKRFKDISILQAKEITVSSKKEENYVSVDLYATKDQNAELFLESSTKVIYKENILLMRGKNQIDLPLENDKVVEGLWVRLKGEEDAVLENNRVFVQREAPSFPRFLHIGTNGNHVAVQNLFEALGAKSQFAEPEKAETFLETLNDFDGIVLDNCDGNRLSKYAVEMIKRGVHNDGKGLFVIGGDKAFGLGSYKARGLESILPVEDKVTGPRPQSDTAVVVVLDTSGSMSDDSEGLSKVALAKGGVKAILEGLNERDWFGLLAFSDTYEWVQPLGPFSKGEKFVGDFSSLGARGGTLIKPSLVKAYEALKAGPEKKKKHILLVTDGWGEQGQYGDFILALKNESITLSAVGVGKEAEDEFLSTLCKEAGGSYYPVKTYEDLPQIMLRDVYKHGKTILQSGNFSVESGTENVYAYVATTLKDDAEPIWRLGSYDPLLAKGRFGMGTVLVLTTAMDKGWSGTLFSKGRSEELVSALRNIRSDIKNEVLQGRKRANVLTLSWIGNPHRLAIFFEGEPIFESTAPFKNRELEFSTQGKKGQYTAVIYDKLGQPLGKEKMNLDYSAEYDISFSRAIWESHKNVVNRQAIAVERFMINTGLFLWPLVLIFFLLSIFFRD